MHRYLLRRLKSVLLDKIRRNISYLRVKDNKFEERTNERTMIEISSIFIIFPSMRSFSSKSKSANMNFGTACN